MTCTGPAAARPLIPAQPALLSTAVALPDHIGPAVRGPV